jgi:hypothetical protein
LCFEGLIFVCGNIKDPKRSELENTAMTLAAALDIVSDFTLVVRVEEVGNVWITPEVARFGMRRNRTIGLGQVHRRRLG